MPIFNTTLLNVITSDSEENLYVTDALPQKIYRINVSTKIVTVVVNNNPQCETPVGLIFDKLYNRLLVTTHPDDGSNQAGSLQERGQVGRDGSLVVYQ